MANEVYTKTHDGLATLVSARAAQRVLERALHKAGQTADTVSGRHMKKLLLGPVLRELETTLPRDGLQRTLKKLASEVNRARLSASPDPAGVEAPQMEDAAGEAGEVFEGDALQLYEASLTAQGEADEMQDDAPGEFVPVAPAAVTEYPVDEAPQAPAQTPPTPASPVAASPVAASSVAASPVTVSPVTASPVTAPAQPSLQKFKTLPPLTGAQLEAAGAALRGARGGQAGGRVRAEG